MSILRTVKRRVWNDASERSNAELVFGLPLEVGERKIYPVYRVSDPPQAGNDQGPRQIGFVETEGNRADFTSLESSSHGPIGLALLVTVLVVGAWLLRRSRG